MRGKRISSRIADCSGVSPHVELPSEKSAHIDARAGSGSLPSNEVSTIAASKHHEQQSAGQECVSQGCSCVKNPTA